LGAGAVTSSASSAAGGGFNSPNGCGAIDDMCTTPRSMTSLPAPVDSSRACRLLLHLSRSSGALVPLPPLVVVPVVAGARTIAASGVPPLLSSAIAMLPGLPSTTHGPTLSSCGWVRPCVATRPSCNHNSTPSLLHPTTAGAAGEASAYITNSGPFASALSLTIATVILDLVDRGLGPAVPRQLLQHHRSQSLASSFSTIVFKATLRR
jgi:hypothetical protein